MIYVLILDRALSLLIQNWKDNFFSVADESSCDVLTQQITQLYECYFEYEAFSTERNLLCYMYMICIVKLST